MNSTLYVCVYCKGKTTAEAGNDKGAMSLACKLSQQHPHEMAAWSLRAYLHALRDTYGTLETNREAKDEAIRYANQGAKCLRLPCLHLP